MYSPGDKIDRQYGTLDQIRPDHIKRYFFATKLFQQEKVLDIACGCGYGSFLLHGAGNEVTGVDVCEEAIAYARRYYQGPTYRCQKAEETTGEYQALVSFETLEHLPDPAKVLEGIKAEAILASVPNELLLPFDPEKFKDDTYPHLRHYTPDEFVGLIEGAGYKTKAIFAQKDKWGEIEPGVDGIFLIAYACR